MIFNKRLITRSKNVGSYNHTFSPNETVIFWHNTKYLITITRTRYNRMSEEQVEAMLLTSVRNRYCNYQPIYTNVFKYLKDDSR